MTTTQVAYQQLLETRRANMAKEEETRRSNVENENIKRYGEDTKRYSAETDRKSYDLRKDMAPFEKINSMSDSFYKVSAGAEKQTKAVKNVGDMISIIGSLFS